MPAKAEGKLVLWPRYFDRSLSRSQGRRVPYNLAVKRPDVEGVAAAAKKCGLSPEVEEEARHPALPHKVQGRVLLPAGDKEAVIRQVAQKMVESQQP